MSPKEGSCPCSRELDGEWTVECSPNSKRAIWWRGQTSPAAVYWPITRVMSVPKSIAAVASGQAVRVVVWAKPGAKKSNVVSIDDEAVAVQIAAPAREGAANEELIDFMSHVLGVRSRCITLDTGCKSRNKTLIVTINKTAEDVFAVLKANITNK